MTFCCKSILFDRCIEEDGSVVEEGGVGPDVHLPCRRAGILPTSSELGIPQSWVLTLVGRGPWLGRLGREDANLSKKYPNRCGGAA